MKPALPRFAARTAIVLLFGVALAAFSQPTADRGDGTFRNPVRTAFDGRLLLVIHKYFRQPATRVQIYELAESATRIHVKRQMFGAP